MNALDFQTEKLFTLEHTRACAYLKMHKFPWEAIRGITRFVRALSQTLGDDYEEVEREVFVHRTVKLSPSALFAGPCIIGPESEVRQCAYVRGGVLVGEGCVVGNSVELKNSILFDDVQVPHLSYVGDSILGYKAHLGAGAVTSNVKADRSLVTIAIGTERVETCSYKCGAILGDGVEIGCNAVLCPGTVVGRNTTIYPLTLARGAYPSNSIVKGPEVVHKRAAPLSPLQGKLPPQV